MFGFISIFILLMLVLIAAFFSACETAITSASRARFHQMAKEGSPHAVIVIDLQNQIGVVLSAVLTLNTLLNAAVVSIATREAMKLWNEAGVAAASVFVSFFIVIYAEIMPKMGAFIAPERFLLFAATPLNFVLGIFKPLNRLLTWFARLNLRVVGVKVNQSSYEHATIEEVRGVIDLHKGPGQDVAEERAMLKSILDLGRVHLTSIMTHRKNVRMINAADPMSHIVDQILACPYTRLPIFEGEAENIVGVIHTKALLRAVQQRPDDWQQLKITDLASPPWFVPENTDLLEQLNAFKKRREHFAIVVDEYGAWMGIVTLEDILEEIVGDITDEHDITVEGITGQPDGSYLVDGSVTLRDLNRQLNWDLPDDEGAATVAGLLLYTFKIIPKEGQTFVLSHYRLEVISRYRNQISLVRIRRVSGGSGTE